MSAVHHDHHTKDGQQRADGGWYSSSYEGRTGGTAFDDSLYIDNILSTTLVAIRVRAGEYIDGIQFCYTRKGQPFNAPAHGGNGGTDYEFRLSPGEHIVRIEGRAGKYVDQLRFITNKGNSSRIYGGNGGDPFFWQTEPLYPHSGLLWISGRSGHLIDGLQGFFSKDIK